jgi:hypothetical protein
MRNLGKASLLTGAAMLLATPMAFAQPTTAEFKCEAAVSKNGAKFVAAKAKCVDKCLTAFWKTGSTTPESDCLPPYGGTTYECIVTNPLKPGKSAEEKFALAIKKACDPATKPGTECPSCYGGDCSDSGFATNQVQNIEGQVDSFVPGVACERTGADKFEQKCQKGTAKALVKQVGSVVKCYDKCKANEFKGTVTAGTCNPPASDPATQACVAKGNTKAIGAIDKICGVTTAAWDPDCGGPDNYPDGAAWVNLVDIAISGNIPTTYCEN